MKVLVTGAAGFIGKNLCDDLVERGHEVYCLVRASSKRDALQPLGVKFVEGDITDEESLKKAPPVEIIIHCAAEVEERGLDKLLAVNLVGTRNICRLSLHLGVKRLVYLSSIAVVNGHSRVPMVEDLPYWPNSPYGISKVEAEKEALEYRARGLPVAVIRPGMVYGEGEPHLSGLLFSLLKFRLLALPERGRRIMHMVYVKNLCEVVLSAMEDEKFLDGTFFSLDEDALTCAEVFAILSSSAGLPRPMAIPVHLTPFFSLLPVIGPNFCALCRDRKYDIGRIKSLGYRDRLPARAALEKMGRSFRK